MDGNVVGMWNVIYLSVSRLVRSFCSHYVPLAGTPLYGGVSAQEFLSRVTRRGPDVWRALR